MSRLKVTVGDDETLLVPDRAYVIGRGQVADIAVDGASVSRHHADVVFDGRMWTVVDRSSAGTFLNGDKVDQAVVDQVLDLSLGGSGGTTVKFAPVVESDGALAPVIDVDEGNSQVGTIALNDKALRLDLNDQHLAVMPGTRVVVGRDSDCDLVTSDRVVSGKHCSFEHDDNNWILTDLGSTRGTFVDGRKLKKPMIVEGAFHVGLGGDTGGSQLRVVTEGEHESPKQRNWLASGVVGVVVLLVAAVGAYVLIPRDVNSVDQVAQAKLATAWVLDPYGFASSGAFISEDLILTNRHVADVGVGTEFSILTTGTEDEPVVLTHLAELVALHPYLDVAVLRVTSGVDPDGQETDPAPPPAVLAVGDSSDMRAGSAYHAFGFPGLTTQFRPPGEDSPLVTTPVTVAEGEVLTFQLWPGCELPNYEEFLVPGGSSECAPDGSLDRGNLVTSHVSGNGASGGPLVVDGEIVAVHYAGKPPVRPVVDLDTGEVQSIASSTTGTGLGIPSELFLEWVEGVMNDPASVDVAEPQQDPPAPPEGPEVPDEPVDDASGLAEVVSSARDAVEAAGLCQFEESDNPLFAICSSGSRVAAFVGLPAPQVANLEGFVTSIVENGCQAGWTYVAVMVGDLGVLTLDEEPGGTSEADLAFYDDVLAAVGAANSNQVEVECDA